MFLDLDGEWPYLSIRGNSYFLYPGWEKKDEGRTHGMGCWLEGLEKRKFMRRIAGGMVIMINGNSTHALSVCTLDASADPDDITPSHWITLSPSGGGSGRRESYLSSCIRRTSVYGVEDIVPEVFTTKRTEFKVKSYDFSFHPDKKKQFITE